MIKRVTRPEIRKMLKEKGAVDIKIGTHKYGVIYGGTYNKTVCSMEELEESYKYAISNGWAKNSVFMINEK